MKQELRIKNYLFYFYVVLDPVLTFLSHLWVAKFKLCLTRIRIFILDGLTLDSSRLIVNSEVRDP